MNGKYFFMFVTYLAITCLSITAENKSKQPFHDSGGCFCKVGTIHTHRCSCKVSRLG